MVSASGDQSGGKEGVNILDPKELLQMAQDKSQDGRAKLAGAISHFFDEHELNDVQQKLASEILLNLVRQAERDLREALAERLSVQDKVPAEIILFFANDDISVAEKILAHSPVLKDIDLMYVISSKSAEYWQAIAKRETLSPMVADRLIDTSDIGTVMNLIDNQRVVLQKSAMKKIVKVALHSEELQAPLLRRPEVDAELATDLFMVVSDALRREITDRFPIHRHAIEQSFDQLVHELSSAAYGSRQTTTEMRVLARRFNERNEIVPDLLIRTLRRGQIGFFIGLFAEKVSLEPEHIVKMIQKDGGKPFVIACRSTGMVKPEFASIFLLSRGIRTGDKIVDQRELAVALKQFDAIKDYDVMRIMQSWVKNPGMI